MSNKTSPEQFSAWPNEISKILDLKRQPLGKLLGDYMIEIGCFQGQSSKEFAQSQDFWRATLVCIDPWDEVQDGAGEGIYQSFLKNIDPFDNIEVIREKSIDADVEKYRGSTVLVFVDGLHSFEGCLADLQKYEPLLAPGGYMVVHDVLDIVWGPAIMDAIRTHRNGKSFEIYAYSPTTEEATRYAHGISGIAYWRKE